MGRYASATIYFASKKYLPSMNKSGLRNAVHKRGDLFEVNLISTPVSPGGLVNLATAFTLVDEIHVRSDDLTQIIGTIVGHQSEDSSWQYVVK